MPPLASPALSVSGAMLAGQSAAAITGPRQTAFQHPAADQIPGVRIKAPAAASPIRAAQRKATGHHKHNHRVAARRIHRAAVGHQAAAGVRSVPGAARIRKERPAQPANRSPTVQVRPGATGGRCSPPIRSPRDIPGRKPGHIPKARRTQPVMQTQSRNPGERRTEKASPMPFRWGGAAHTA